MGSCKGEITENEQRTFKTQLEGDVLTHTQRDQDCYPFPTGDQ